MFIISEQVYYYYVVTSLPILVWATIVWIKKYKTLEKITHDAQPISVRAAILHGKLLTVSLMQKYSTICDNYEILIKKVENMERDMMIKIK